MRTMRIIKVIAYPVVGALQLFLVPSHLLGIVLCVALCGIAALHFDKLLKEDSR